MSDEKASLGERFRRLGSLAASTVLVLALSFAIAWPIWSFATGARRAYTLAVIAFCSLVAVSLVSLAASRRIRGGSRYRARARRRRGAP
jgi:hypothetical protein